MSRSTLFSTLLVVCALAVNTRAQTFKVMHAFSGSDGAYPYTGMTWDREGNLYGTTSAGGVGCPSSQGCGTVFRLSRSGAEWKLTTIYPFRGFMDGWFPIPRVVFGPDGNLYGTTYYGGNQGKNGYGFGTVYKLTPPASDDSLAEWTHTVIYRFTGGSDGSTPGVGDLIFDPDDPSAPITENKETLYGTTPDGRPLGKSYGNVFQMTPTAGLGRSGFCTPSPLAMTAGVRKEILSWTAGELYTALRTWRGSTPRA